MSIDPRIWGEHGWFFLHSVALAYPNNPTELEKANIKTFYTTLGEILPCYKCRNNYAKHLDKFPITDKVLSNRVELVNWLNLIHNEVDKMVARDKKIKKALEEKKVFKSGNKLDIGEIGNILIVFVLLSYCVFYIIKSAQ